jgi:hypothetical protein
MNAETPRRGAGDAKKKRQFRTRGVVTPSRSCARAAPAADENDRHPDGRLADLRDLGKE